MAWVLSPNELIVIGDAVVNKIGRDYLGVHSYYFDDSTRHCMGFEASIKAPDSEVFTRTVYITDRELEEVDDPQNFIIKKYFGCVEDLINSIPIEKIGLYPFARFWADAHGPAPVSNQLLWHPDRDIPGWIFSRAYQVYPRDKGKDEATTLRETNIDPVENTRWNVEFDRMKEAFKVATTTKKTVKKKKTVTRAPFPKFDPEKVKPPECPLHSSTMEFDMMEQKWRCMAPGCKQVARPKRDADDKSVILGKGSVQLRLIAQEGKRSVVLISDDNVCVDVTSLIDMEELLEAFDVIDQAKIASDNGREVFPVSEKHIGLRARLVVMGATDLTE